MPKFEFSLPSGALSVSETATYLRVSTATVWRLIRDNKLSRARIGGRVVVRRVDVDAFLARAVDAA
jgi:excisionase family DNA binding protein